MIPYMPPTSTPIAFTHAQARDLGISDRDLATLTAQGDLERIARGIYARPGHGADPDLLELALRNPHTTLCLATALAHHDLTDEIPHTIDAALPRQHWQPRTELPSLGIGSIARHSTSDATSLTSLRQSPSGFTTQPAQSSTPTDSVIDSASTSHTQPYVAGSTNAATIPPSSSN